MLPRGRLAAYSAGGGSVEVGSLPVELKTATGFSMGLPARTQRVASDRVASSRSVRSSSFAPVRVAPMSAVCLTVVVLMSAPVRSARCR